MPWSPIPCESTANGEQLVGFRRKPGRSMLTRIERRRSGMPPMICGTLSEAAVTWASSGSTLIATRTTWVP